jgi:type II secretory pathway pseudopilin PulG
MRCANPNTPQYKRVGLTLIEVVVSLTLIAVLTAVTVPAIRGSMRSNSASAVVNELSTIESALRAYRQDVGRMPPDISYLFALPTSPTDWCATPRTLPTALKNRWHGPYINRPVTAGSDYSLIDNDTVQTSISWSSVSFGSTTYTVGQITMRSVDTATAQIVDVRIDGAVDPVNGRLRWLNSPLPTLTYYFPITSADAC